MQTDGKVGRFLFPLIIFSRSVVLYFSNLFLSKFFAIHKHSYQNGQEKFRNNFGTCTKFVCLSCLKPAGDTNALWVDIAIHHWGLRGID